MLILNSAEAAQNLLDKRSANYSDRPFPAMSGTLMKREKSMFMMWVSHYLKRKLLHVSLVRTTSA
jgi:hypothetical protein